MLEILERAREVFYKTVTGLVNLELKLEGDTAEGAGEGAGLVGNFESF